VLVRLLGAIPGPIIVGALFDSSCVYWREECGSRGNCWVYDNNDLSLRMFGTTFSVRIVSVIIAFCGWIFFDVILCNRGKMKEQENDTSGKEMTAVVDSPATNAHANGQPV